MLPDSRPPNAPGDILREEFIRGEGRTIAEVARACGLSEATIEALCAGKRRMDLATARALETGLRMPAHMWLGLQAQRERFVAQGGGNDTLEVDG